MRVEAVDLERLIGEEPIARAVGAVEAGGVGRGRSCRSARGCGSGSSARISGGRGARARSRPNLAVRPAPAPRTICRARAARPASACRNASSASSRAGPVEMRRGWTAQRSRRSCWRPRDSAARRARSPTASPVATSRSSAALRKRALARRFPDPANRGRCGAQPRRARPKSSPISLPIVARNVSRALRTASVSTSRASSRAMSDSLGSLRNSAR